MKYLILALVIQIVACETAKKEYADSSDNVWYQIGTKSFSWTDTSRVDYYYGGNRIINVKIWYPIDSIINDQKHIPSEYYFKIKDAYKKLDNWSENDFEMVSEIKPLSVPNAQISKKKGTYPLLIYSPSLGGNLSLYTYYAEQFAKSGYIVAGINHLYESEYVLDDSGNVFPSNNTFHDSLKTLSIPEQITADRYRAVKGDRQLVLGQDLVFCLDKITALNNSEFEGKIDLDKVGAWGHSIGGAGAVYASVLDKRFKAITDLDGTPPSIVLENGIDVPFMFIEDLTDYENHTGYQKLHLRRNLFCERIRSDATRVLIGGFNHNSFLDMDFYFAENEMDKKLALKPLQKTHSYMSQFFDHHLKNAELTMNDFKSDTLEILTFPKK